MRSVAVTPHQGKYLYCVHFFFCIHLCIIIQQRYSATKGGRRVVMATPSLGPAAKFLNVFAQVFSRQELQREKGQSEVELTPELPATSACPTDALTSQQAQRDQTPARTNKPTLCPSVSLVHLRPFHSGVHPIHLETEEEGTRQQRTKQGRGRSEWEDEKCAEVT